MIHQIFKPDTTGQMPVDTAGDDEPISPVMPQVPASPVTPVRAVDELPPPAAPPSDYQEGDTYTEGGVKAKRISGNAQAMIAIAIIAAAFYFLD